MSDSYSTYDSFQTEDNYSSLPSTAEKIFQVQLLKLLVRLELENGDLFLEILYENILKMGPQNMLSNTSYYLK
jgi:hypothetical protein